MNESIARAHLACPVCRRGALDTVAFEREGPVIIHGVLVCGACRNWYRIEDRVPELLDPSLRDPGSVQAFRGRFEARWAGWDLPGPTAIGRGSLKQEQIHFFRTHAVQYDSAIIDSPFWNAVDRRLLARLEATCPRRGVTVEVGAGTGRFTLELTRRFETVVHLDLSEEMVRAAMRRHDLAGRPGRTLFVVGDAERLPLVSATADCVVVAGTFSYLADPARALGEAARVLTPDGVFIAHENNASAARPLFEMLARFWRPWVEKSWPPQGTISGDALEAWCGAVGLSPHVWTGVFLPPQILNLLPAPIARGLLDVTDALAGRLPWIRRQGGLLFVDAHLTGAA